MYAFNFGSKMYLEIFLQNGGKRLPALASRKMP